MASKERSILIVDNFLSGQGGHDVSEALAQRDRALLGLAGPFSASPQASGLVPPSLPARADQSAAEKPLPEESGSR